MLHLSLRKNPLFEFAFDVHSFLGSDFVVDNIAEVLKVLRTTKIKHESTVSGTKWALRSWLIHCTQKPVIQTNPVCLRLPKGHPPKIGGRGFEYLPSNVLALAGLGRAQERRSDDENDKREFWKRHEICESDTRHWRNLSYSWRGRIIMAACIGSDHRWGVWEKSSWIGL